MDKTVDGSMIEVAFGDKISERGRDYFERDFVIHVMRLNNILYGEVGGRGGLSLILWRLI